MLLYNIEIVYLKYNKDILCGTLPYWDVILDYVCHVTAPLGIGVDTLTMFSMYVYNLSLGSPVFLVTLI